MVGDGVMAVAGAGRLQDLAADQAFERVGLEPYGPRPQPGQEARGAGEEEVAGEHGDGGVRLVPYVVVVARRQMGQLDDDRRGHHARRARIAEPGGQQHQQRP